MTGLYVSEKKHGIMDVRRTEAPFFGHLSLICRCDLYSHLPMSSSLMPMPFSNILTEKPLTHTHVACFWHLIILGAKTFFFLHVLPEISHLELQTPALLVLPLPHHLNNPFLL